MFAFGDVNFDYEVMTVLLNFRIEEFPDVSNEQRRVYIAGLFAKIVRLVCDTAMVNF